MRKTMKKLLGAALAIALCVTMLPAQTAKAEENSSATSGTNSNINYMYRSNYGEANMTEEQLLEAFLGEWDNGSVVMTKEHITFSKYDWDVEKTVVVYETDWEFKESFIKTGLALDDETYWLMLEGRSEGQAAKALRFVSEDYEWNLYKGYNREWGNIQLAIEKLDKETGAVLETTYTYAKTELGSEMDFATRIYNVLAAIGERDGVVECEVTVDAAGETPIEEPKPEDTTTETPAEETPAEEPKEETPKAEASGREVLEGESVYIVKKGDCLWSIAKALLGNGAKYKELFTRNGDIVEKAELIFPGQEIIVPAK